MSRRNTKSATKSNNHNHAKEPTSVFNLRIHRSLNARLRKEAEAQHRTVASLVRHLVEMGLEECRRERDER
jgi:predicted HicB family RNase H-like nuclease